jgi:dienelactone hydrolase
MAANLWGATHIVPYSNFDMRGPAPVGHYTGVGDRGAFDMAGNVKEWCRNGTGSDGTHYILGGAWNEPKYMFNDPDYYSPRERAETFGFRCIQILDEDGTDPEVDNDVSVYRRDFTQVEPVSDAVFEAHKSEYAYDKTSALNAQVLLTKDHGSYTHEKIVFDAAYGDEKVTAHLYCPKNVDPPYQTIVYFPPGNAVTTSQFDETKISWQISFLVEAGRAVIFPIYKGTFERRTDRLPNCEVAQSVEYKNFVIMWSQDLSRTIDYLEQRQDIDPDRIGYYGYSWGGMMGAILPAMESRLKVQLLSGVGLSGMAPLPAVDQVNFVTRVSLPTLMLSGEFNTFFPIEKSVQPFYELLGTAQTDKKLKTYKSGQFVPDKELRKESAAWFDKYLGPVQPKAATDNP